MVTVGTMAGAIIGMQDGIAHGQTHTMLAGVTLAGAMHGAMVGTLDSAGLQ